MNLLFLRRMVNSQPYLYTVYTESTYSVTQELIRKVVEVKVKQSLHMPGQALRVPGVKGTQILRQSAHECG
jgi:hypothetical protein